MLEVIIETIKKSISKIEGTTLFCSYTIENVALINDFYENEIIENLSIESYINGDQIELEFSIFKLQKYGFFIDKRNFVRKYRYVEPINPIYFYTTNDYLHDSSFYSKYKTIVELIKELRNISKFNYDEVEINNVLIVREEKSLLMGFIYESSDIEELNEINKSSINNFIDILKDESLTDKKNIYLNELVEFAITFEENIRFSSFVKYFKDYYNKAFSTYTFYLRNFSYNKLKIELDSKALEFNQKLQSVINDSQSKLIAIPTAFILVLSNLDYDKINNNKNIVSVLGLFIFSSLIQLFVNNQKSTLKFIEENIEHYKSTFKNQNVKEIEKAFKNVNSEKLKQTDRIILIELILWFVPIFTICVLLYFMAYNFLALLFLAFYFWFSCNKYLLK